MAGWSAWRGRRRATPAGRVTIVDGALMDSIVCVDRFVPSRSTTSSSPARPHPAPIAAAAAAAGRGPVPNGRTDGRPVVRQSGHYVPAACTTGSASVRPSVRRSNLAADKRPPTDRRSLGLRPDRIVCVAVNLHHNIDYATTQVGEYHLSTNKAYLLTYQSLLTMPAFSISR